METQYQPNYGSSYDSNYGSNLPLKPNDYKGWSIVGLILSIFCCCNCNIVSFILSILALIKSFDVQKYYEMGAEGVMQAKDASEKAKLFNIISYAFMGVWFVILIIYYAISGFAAILDAL